MRGGRGRWFTALGLALVTGASPAWAHKFELVFVAPFSGPEQARGRQALDGLMFATAEEDSHANEHSDGHLGGLDAYVLRVDSASGLRAATDEVTRLLHARGPIFVTGLLDADTRHALARLVAEHEAVVVDPAASVSWRAARAAADDVRAMSGALLAPAFEARYGYAPTDVVLQGYVAARLIAAVVRSLPEAALGERAALETALARFRERALW